MPQETHLTRILKLLSPFLLWLFLFKDFIIQRAIHFDTFANYTLTTFFVNNLKTGAYPLWCPFLYLWGMPFDCLEMDVVFYPHIIFIWILNALGLDLLSAYMVWLITYYFIGLVGFYLLAKILWKDEPVAYLAYALLMFSGAGPTIFNQAYILILFVPAVWFFYFLFRFLQDFKKSHFVALASTIVIAITSYNPFYFAVLFLCFLTCSIFCYRNSIVWAFSAVRNFISTHRIVFILCILAVAVASFPMSATLSYRTEMVIPARHNHDYQKTMSSASLTMEYPELRGGNLAERVHPKGLFSHLDKVSYRREIFFFLPVFSYLILCVAAVTRFNRRVIILFCLSLFLFFLSLTDVTSVHPFLYRYVFPFKLFRNLYLFAGFIMPLVVLLTGEQLKLLLQSAEETTKKRAYTAIPIVLLHIGFLFFLISQGHVIVSSYLTVILSLALFMFYFLRPSKIKREYFISGLIFLALLQPLEVYIHYRKNAEPLKFYSYPVSPQPSFSFIRPLRDSEIFRALKKEYRLFYPSKLRFLTMNDAPLDVDYVWYSTKWAYDFRHHIGEEILKGYVKYKFVLYDSIKAYGKSSENFDEINDALVNRKNMAFISLGPGKKSPPMRHYKQNPDDFFSVVINDSEYFSVVDFGVNFVRLATHFDSDKFLVYNDSFHSGWKAFLNEKRVPLYRANVAFKGVHLPAGKNTLIFRFEPCGGEFFYIFMAGLICVFFVYSLVLLCREDFVAKNGAVDER